MEKTNRLTPLFDRIVLAQITEQKSESGVIIPRGMDERSQTMTVVNAGESKRLRVGDNVILAKYAGTEVVLGGERFLIACEYDILGVVAHE
jgi:chaperonin GroES